MFGNPLCFDFPGLHTICPSPNEPSCLPIPEYGSNEAPPHIVWPKSAHSSGGYCYCYPTLTGITFPECAQSESCRSQYHLVISSQRNDSVCLSDGTTLQGNDSLRVYFFRQRSMKIYGEMRYFAVTSFLTSYVFQSQGTSYP